MLEPFEFGPTTLEPAETSFHRDPRRFFRRLAGHDVIELHDDVGAEVALDAHDRLGGELMERPVKVAAKLDTSFGDRAQAFE